MTACDRPVAWWNTSGLHTYIHYDDGPFTEPTGACLRHPTRGDWWHLGTGSAAPALCPRTNHPALHAHDYDLLVELSGMPMYWCIYGPKHRACPLHRIVGEDAVWGPPPGVAPVCADDCWTRDHARCASWDGHRPGYDVYCAEERWCPRCEGYERACGEDHCIDCGTPT